MNTKIRRRLTILIGSMFLTAALIGVAASAQSTEIAVSDGESLENISIGKSTMGDVIAHYGADYKLIQYRDYSYRMFYEKLGLSFYSCQADPNKEIFVIEMQSPAKIKTAKGVTLGESTFADVARFYGVKDPGERFEAEGIVFHAGLDEDDEDDTEEPANEILPAAAEQTEVKSTVCLPGERSDQSQIVLDGIDVDETDQTSAEKEKAETQAASFPKNEPSETDKKPLIVKRIELIEKTGLRQCDAKFPEKLK